MFALPRSAAGEPPDFVVDGSLQPTEAIRTSAASAWSEIAQNLQSAVQWAVPTKSGRVTIHREWQLASAESGRSTTGVISLRQNHEGVLDDAMHIALRHEIAHQLLWLACPASANDRLFHEAFALSASGELPQWTGGAYLNLTAAAAQLAHATSLDTRASRRALARLLRESPTDPGGFPQALDERLRRCAAGSAWEPLTVDELVEAVVPRAADAFVVVNRHSGEILVSEGDWRLPMPLGSTLKPFLVAGVRAREGHEPTLKPKFENPEWACGQKSASAMDVDTALLLSCNGFFLEWGRGDPSIAQFGAFGPVLVSLGLKRLPVDVSEAIGLRPTLTLSPVALAQAYRLLAESRPDVIDVLRQNARRGTLSHLPASPTLEQFALKTGTVRDAESRPTVGWIVAIDDDVIAVMARRQKMPRDFANELLRRVKTRPAQSAAEVQVFGLLDPDDVRVKCPRFGFIAGSRGPEALGHDELSLVSLVKKGTAMCLGAPWIFQDREYAGVFRFDPAPPYEGRVDDQPSERARRARRGSDIVFRTSLVRYAAGAVHAEDDRLTGNAREALLRVVAHNAREHRHGSRPLCDTTHCQAFRGTYAPQKDDERAVARDVPGAKGWLLFSQGGAEPWERSRSLLDVESILGRGATALRFEHGRVRYVRQDAGGQLFDESLSVPCDDLREGLKLPACPDSVRTNGAELVFSGHGQGHGQGLDVERARRELRLGADAILREAYAR